MNHYSSEKAIFPHILKTTIVKSEQDDSLPQKIRSIPIHSNPLRTTVFKPQYKMCKVEVNPGDQSEPEEIEFSTVPSSISHTPLTFDNQLVTLIKKTTTILANRSPQINTRNTNRELGSMTIFNISSSNFKSRANVASEILKKPFLLCKNDRNPLGIRNNKLASIKTVIKKPVLKSVKATPQHKISTDNSLEEHISKALFLLSSTKHKR
jgi:hypothetical protein